MIKNFKLFELTYQEFSRQFKKERDDSIDKNIPSIPGRYYWKIKADDFNIIKASLDKLGAPKEIFDEICLSNRKGLIGKNHFIEIYHNENYKNEDKYKFSSLAWNWEIWEHDKKLKGFDDRRYQAGYKYMGVVKPEEERVAAIKYNL